VGQRLDGTVMPLAVGVGTFSVVVATVAWTVVQRHGEPPRPAAVAPA
jgi:DHA1 family bicyclomycin/chloramphenicol resistance-like MFS transporter